MMSSKKNTKISSHYRTGKPTSAPTSKTRSGKRKRDENELQEPGVVDRSQGEGAVSRADVAEDELVLRRFDLQTKFGPCAGITRLERWDRAQKFNLNPPAEVRDILMALGGLGCEANYCLWHERI